MGSPLIEQALRLQSTVSGLKTLNDSLPGDLDAHLRGVAPDEQPHVPESEGSIDRLHRSVGELGKLGIGLLPPKKEDLKRMIDKQKNQATIPQGPRKPGTCPSSILGI